MSKLHRYYALQQIMCYIWRITCSDMKMGEILPQNTIPFNPYIVLRSKLTRFHFSKF